MKYFWIFIILSFEFCVWEAKGNFPVNVCVWVFISLTLHKFACFFVSTFCLLFFSLCQKVKHQTEKWVIFCCCCWIYSSMIARIKAWTRNTHKYNTKKYNSFWSSMVHTGKMLNFKYLHWKWRNILVKWCKKISCQAVKNFHLLFVFLFFAFFCISFLLFFTFSRKVFFYFILFCLLCVCVCIFWDLDTIYKVSYVAYLTMRQTHRVRMRER